MGSIPPEFTDRISGQEPITPGRPTVQPETASSTFQSALQEGTKTPSGTPIPGSGQPASLQGPAAQVGKPTPDSLLAQISTSQDTFGNLQNLLNTKDLKLTRSQQHLMRNKLGDASTFLRAANSKLGIDTPPMQIKAGSRPIERFLSYVTDGENQLMEAKSKLAKMGSDNNFNASDMILVQVKLGQAQQELDYASLLLSKVVSAITQVLNTQL